MSFKHKWKPETLARHAKQAAERRITRHAEMIEQIRANAERDGPDSIWPEMLAETLARDAAESAVVDLNGQLLVAES